MNFKEEYIRCLRDKTRKYFIEHYLSTFNADERKEVPFRLFPRQVEFLHSLCENRLQSLKANSKLYSLKDFINNIK